jgi:3-deoxy-D-manno-octulosonic-acid transferase
MGEVRVAGQFAPELTAHGHTVIASTMTETGYSLCGQIMPDIAAHFRIPFDLPGPVRRAFIHYNPCALVLVETEWWPNFLLESARAKVPVFVINGRLSKKAYGRYRLGRAYWSSVLSGVDFFYMRSSDDAERVCSLGIDPTRVRAVGAIKAIAHDENHFELELPNGSQDNGGPIWIAGCTRPGEEELILSAYTTLRREFPDLRLWLAPRHPDRFHEVAGIIAETEQSYSKWSDVGAMAGNKLPPGKLILIDKLGVLAGLYRHATVAFIGGSLVPFGGHNPLEPALVGTPVTFGHHMDEQRDAADMLLANGLAREVWGAESLAIAVSDYLRNPIPVELRKKQIAELTERLGHTRSQVADDICWRIARLANASA